MSELIHVGTYISHPPLLRMSNIPLYEHTTTRLFIHVLPSTGAASNLQLSPTVEYVTMEYSDVIPTAFK